MTNCGVLVVLADCVNNITWPRQDNPRWDEHAIREPGEGAQGHHTFLKSPSGLQATDDKLREFKGMEIESG